MSHHPSILLASSNHCVCSLDHYRSKEVTRCFSRLYCISQRGNYGLQEQQRNYSSWCPFYRIYHSLNEPYSLSLCTYVCSAQNIPFYFPLVKPLSFTSSEKPPLTISFTLGRLYVSTLSATLTGCGLLRDKAPWFLNPFCNPVSVEWINCTCATGENEERREWGW